MLIFDHKDIRAFASGVMPTGSRVICKPAPTDTDADFVVLAKDTWCGFEILEHLEELGYTTTSGRDEYADMGEFDDGCGFMSFKKGEINYIVTPSKTMFEAFLIATHEAAVLNLLDKDDRIKLFRKHLYGEEE